MIKKLKNILFILFFISVLFFVIFFLKQIIFNFVAPQIELPNGRKKIPENIILNVFISVLIVPFCEEVLFRKSLQYSKINSFLYIISVIYTLVYLFFPAINTSEPQNLIVFLSCSSIITLLVYIFIMKKALFFEKIYFHHQKIIIAISILMFTYSHYAMYYNELNINNLLKSPLVLYQHFINGIFYTFLRIKFGFWYALLAHVIWNLLALILA